MTARRTALGAIALACLAASVAVLPSPAVGSPTSPEAPSAPAQERSRVSGRGSSYVGPAMVQWTADAYARGLEVGYLPVSSPDGLGQYQASTVDFAGTEAEFSSLLGLGNDNQVARGFQYVPDVAGAVAIMYNVTDQAGRKVDYLRLRRETVARIFIGEITRWSDPAITNDLGGQIVLPDQPIRVVYRSGQSGTTALFYDFVANMIPGAYDQFVRDNGYPQGVRLIDPGASPNFIPGAIGLAGSDQMAQTVARTPWTITYDEFAYARQYNVTTAWVQNESGQFVLPYAGNISAALDSATLRPDLSQDLRQVYRSRADGAYPISAYSYIVTQCAPASDRATCRGGYSDAGKAGTLGEWLRYIACDGQIQMDDIGYSPLPRNLSQEMINSIGRMTGDPPPIQLNAGNCRNPRFDPNYRPPPPPGPPPLPPPVVGGGGPGGPAAGPGAGDDAGPADGASTSTTAASTSTQGEEQAAVGREGGARAVGGGSDDWRPGDPVGYAGPGASPIGRAAVATLLALLALPLLIGPIRARIRRRRA